MSRSEVEDPIPTVGSETPLQRMGRRLEAVDPLWRRRDVWLGVTWVLVLLLTRFGDMLWGRQILFDEGVYLEAFAAVRADLSPYDVAGYFYPPAFAHAGAVLGDRLGEDAVRLLLRLANWAGLLFIATRVVRWTEAATGETGPRFWAVLGPALALATGVTFALTCANVSFLAAALLLLALELTPRRPISAGLLLAFSVSIKPFAAPAVLALAMAGTRLGKRCWWLTSGVAVFGGMALNLPSPWVLGMLDATPSPLIEVRSSSLHRLAALSGWDLDPLGALALGLVLVAAAAWRWAERPAAVHMTALLGVLAMPVVWNHTLILLLPLVGSGCALMQSQRHYHRSRLDGIWPWLAGLAIVGYQSGAVDTLPWGLQWLVLALPFLGALYLFGLWVTVGDRAEPLFSDSTPSDRGSGSTGQV